MCIRDRSRGKENDARSAGSHRRSPEKAWVAVFPTTNVISLLIIPRASISEPHESPPSTGNIPKLETWQPCQRSRVAKPVFASGDVLVVLDVDIEPIEEPVSARRPPERNRIRRQGGRAW